MKINRWIIALSLVFWISQVSGQAVNPRYLQIDCEDCATALFDIYQHIDSDQLLEASGLITNIRIQLNPLPYTAIKEDILDTLLGLELAIEFADFPPEAITRPDTTNLSPAPSSEFTNLLVAARFLNGLAPHSATIFTDENSQNAFGVLFAELSNTLTYLWASENSLDISSLDPDSVRKFIAIVEEEDLSPVALDVLANVTLARALTLEGPNSAEFQQVLTQFLLEHEEKLRAQTEIALAHRAILTIYDVLNEIAFHMYTEDGTAENMNEYIYRSMELSNQFINLLGERPSDWFRYRVGLNGRRDIFRIPGELPLKPEFEQVFSIGQFATYLYQYPDDIQNLSHQALSQLEDEPEARSALLQALFTKQLEQKTVYPSALSLLQIHGVSQFIEDTANFNLLAELATLASENPEYGKIHPLAIPMLQLIFTPTARVNNLLPEEISTRYLDQAVLLTTDYVNGKPHQFREYDELVKSQFYSILMTSFSNFDGDLRLLFSDLMTMWATITELPAVDNRDITRFMELTLQSMDGTTESSISNLNRIFILLDTTPEHYAANKGGLLSNKFHDGTEFSELDQPLIQYISREYLARLHHYQSENYLELAEAATGSKSDSYLKLSREHKDLATAYYAPYPTIYFEPWNEGFSVDRYKNGIILDPARNIDAFYCDNNLNVATEMLRWRMNVDENLSETDREFLVQKSFEVYESALNTSPTCGEVNSDLAVSLFNFGNTSYRLERPIDFTTELFKRAWLSYLTIAPGIRSYADDIDIELGARILISLCAEEYESMGSENQIFCDSNLLSLLSFTTSGNYAGQLTQGVRIASSMLDPAERSALRGAFGNQTEINEGIDSNKESMAARSELASQRLFLQEQGIDSNYVKTNPISSNTDILNSLTDGELLVTIFSTINDKAIITLWDKSQSPISISFADERAINNLAQEVRNSVTSPFNSRGEIKAFDYEASYELFKLLFSGKKALLERASYITVIVDGLSLSPLNNLPLSVLVETDPSTPSFDQENSWAFKDKLIRRLPSLNALVYLNNQENDSLNRTFSFLGVGNPYLEKGLSSNTRGIEPSNRNSQTINSDYIYSLPSLPETERELLNIQDIVSDNSGTSTLLVGRGATESAFKSHSLEEFDVLAFATHGVIPGEMPGLVESALVFSPNPDQSDDDGLLYFSEIADLNLAAKLVVLSTCNSARQDIDGLSTSFFIGGARSVLATHWELDSKVAEAYTTNFFRNYVSDTEKGYAEALRNARDEISRIPGWQHPYFWAPFSLYGGLGVAAAQ